MMGTVHCDVSALEMSKSGAIWGGIWVSGAERDFPERGWNDLVVALLVELHHAVDRLTRSAGSCRVRFFDGPFWLDLTARPGGRLAVAGRGDRAGIELDAVLDFATFRDQLVSETARVLRQCEVQGWGDQSDVRTLANLVRVAGEERG